METAASAFNGIIKNYLNIMFNYSLHFARNIKLNTLKQ